MYLAESLSFICELVVVDRTRVQSVVLVIVVELIIDKYRSQHDSGNRKGYLTVHLILGALQIVWHCYFYDVVGEHCHGDAYAQKDG